MRHKTMVIWAAPVAALVVLTVFSAPVYAGDAHPNFSPDDFRLVYMSDGEIKIVEIKTGKVINLTNSATADMCPHWSNKRKKIVFDSKRDDPKRDLYVMNIDGKGLRNLTRHEASDQWPAWSHDGKWIAFSSTRTGKEHLYLVRPNSSGLRRVTGPAAADRPQIQQKK